jgi:DNA primase
MARSITGEKGISLTEDFAQMIARTMSGKTNTKPWRGLKLEIPPFKSFTYVPSARMFIEYMKSPQRKFTDEHIALFTPIWGVRYCTTGKFKGRIIFPIYFNKELVSWTGRTVYPGVSPKYLTLSPEGEPPLAKAGISNYLLWYDYLKKYYWDIIVICEGPMDALKVNCLNAGRGIGATCIFTAQPSQIQIDLIHDLLPKTKRMILLLDQGTTANAMRSMQELPKEVEYKTLPKGIKDPCLLTSLDFLV